MATATVSASLVRPAGTNAGRKSARLVYLDNLKVVLVGAVIVAHAALIYGPGGGWIYHEGQVGEVATLLLGIIGLIGGLFWLGLFFLVAGLFAPGSFARHGLRPFLRERLIRLGVPLAVYVVLVMPILHYAVARAEGSGSLSVQEWVHRYLWPLDAGPLWFVGALFLFSSAFALWRQKRAAPAGLPRTLNIGHLVAMVVAMAVLTFIVRMRFLMDTRQFLGLHLWQWPQYLLLFWFGALSAERGWLRGLPDRLWKQCGLGVILAAIAGGLLVLAIARGPLEGQQDVFRGGFHWQAMVTATVECTLAVAASFWLLELFRRVADRPVPLSRALVRGSYGAYVLQGPILIALALALRQVPAAPELKFLIIAPIGVAAAFAGASYLVRLPLLNRVL